MTEPNLFTAPGEALGLEVKDCPFCGDATGLRPLCPALNARDTSQGLSWQVICSFCGASGPLAADEEPAVFAWNRRRP